MRTKTLLLTLLLTAIGAVNLGAAATKLTVKMDATSPTMTIVPKGGETPIETGEPSTRIYEFDIDKGEYVLTAYGKDGETVSGTIEFKILGDSLEQQLTVLTNTLAVTNKKADNTSWVYGEDYTINTIVRSREGADQVVTLGNSVTAGRKTCLAFNGNTIIATFVPSDEHRKEGYTDNVQSRTLTAGVTVSVKIPMGGYYTIPVPKEAGFELNMKFVHFTDFTKVEPYEVKEEGDRTLYTYYLSQGQVYNYRTWMEGKLTQGGYFTYPTDSTKIPEISFTRADYEAYNPKQINLSPQSNDTYETGDIFVNADYRGMLSLNVGESFQAHAMRTWELTDNSTNNYFIEPDFHYTVLDLDGKPCKDVIEIDSTKTTSPWVTITGKNPGTAIVLVTYDAIGLNYYSGKEKKAYLGGEYWGAIWPENTGTYVVTVGESASGIIPNMTVNEKYNIPAEGAKTLKMSGAYVDAEHDVFYYLDTEDCAYYTFTPEGVDNVTIAYPTITETEATYTGFTSDGVVKNEDGSYTLSLRHGRQIVKLTDAQGRSTYQVMRARRCTREISNTSRPGSKVFQPGDRIKIQYNGLYHPANKIAGIYNMSAYVTYNSVPNGSSLILSANQYNFAGIPKAQAVEVDIPEDYDALANPMWVMDEGVIQVNGYGDPIGNHRFIDPIGGRSPNFTAVPHKTYFGYIPDVSIPLSPYKAFDIKLSNPEGADVTLSFNGKELTPGEDGLYNGTYGTYSVIGKKKGFLCFREDFEISDDAEGLQTFNIDLVADASSWDGESVAEAQEIEGVYHISTPEQLAWFAAQINSKGVDASSKVILDSDIQLGGYDWTCIGSSSSNPFTGDFNGNNHSIEGLFINLPDAQYQGLFGYFGANKATTKVHNLRVSGSVTAKAYVGGLVGSSADNTEIDRCEVNVTVTASGNYAGGIVGMLTGKSSKVSNSSNLAAVAGTSNAGGIAGGCSVSAATAPTFENVFNMGEIVGGTTGGCIGSTGASVATKINVFSTFEGRNTAGQETVTPEQMASGEITWLLGEAFGQTIGEEKYPVIGGAKVYKVNYVLVDNGAAVADDSADAENVIYTNGSLPSELNGDEVRWFTDSEMTSQVSAVESDVTLYAAVGTFSGIDNIIGDGEEMNVRWYDLRGIEINAPAPGVHGIFIRVVHGRSEKVVL